MTADQPAKRPRPVMSKRSTPGVLSDDDIHAEVSRGHLIVSGFRRENIHQSCYELRVGSIYYDLSDNSRRIELTTDQSVLLKPFQQIVVITHEELSIPPDIVGRVLLKGRMFSLGISPVHTYADPGFSGQLGIVLFNLSQNYVRLDQGMAIAKIEFERLPNPVSKPYRGQHGFQSGVWPIASQHILSEADIRRDPRIGNPGLELSRTFGPEFGRVFDRIFIYERRLLLSVLVYIFLAMTLIAYANFNNAISTLVAFGIGLITNLASVVLTFLATNVRRVRRANR